MSLRYDLATLVARDGAELDIVLPAPAAHNAPLQPHELPTCAVARDPHQLGYGLLPGPPTHPTPHPPSL
ncbi:hypothetical protein, partial [Burkholderia cenocepacia]|uniref:hypothetical protein n=1 Tax=Burkholderia cenocepacia TaxID=95486 RepID=UPI00406CE41D